MIRLLLFLVVLFGCFSGYQTWQLYQQNDVIANDLSQVVGDYRSEKLASERNVRERVSAIMETHGVDLNKDAFPVKLDERLRTAEFSVDFRKSPELFLFKYPMAFHIDIPKKEQGGSGSIGFVDQARKKAAETNAAEEKKVGDVENVLTDAATAKKNE